MSNYYEILGVERNASKDEIKRAFRKKARECHPDINKAPDAEEKFKELGKAYETLMDDDKRALYDNYGEDGLKNAGFSNSGPFDYGFGSINDIFESFFGNFGGFSSSTRGNPNRPTRGSDLRVDIELEFQEAVFGVEKEIKIQHSELCPRCKGSKTEPGTTASICPTCKGHGQIQQTTRTALGHFTQITDCPDCNGTGQKITTPCKECNGTGFVEKEKVLKVKIPHGVDNGSKIRVSSEGDCGFNGGPAGDLYIVIFVKNNTEFSRDGYNIYSKVEVSMPQAVLGDEIDVNTLEGVKKLNIPAGTQSSKILTLKHHGVPVIGSSSQRGDHLIEVIVKTPTNLSEEEKKLYSKLYELSISKKQHNESLLDKVKNVLHNV